LFSLESETDCISVVLSKVGKYHVNEFEEQKRLSERAVAYAERAIVADGQNFACHKWSGIIVSWSSEFLGTKRKIERSFDIRDHFMVGPLCVCDPGIPHGC
jgi:hypothetical protein